MCETTIARVRIPMFADELLRLDEDDVGADEPQRAHHGPVLVLRGEDLLLRPDAQRADHRIQRGCRVLTEDEVVDAHADERRQRSAGLAHRPGETPREELRRRTLELALEPLVLVEDLDRAGAVPAVVEVRDLRIEEKTIAHRRQCPTVRGFSARAFRHLAGLAEEGTGATIQNMAQTKDDPLSTHAEPPSHPSFARPWRHAGHLAGADRPRAHR